MNAIFVSTNSLHQGTRLGLLKLQSSLIKAQAELASGRKWDIGKEVGARESESISLRQDLARNTTLIDTNSVATVRLSVQQNAISNLSQSAQAFVSTLIAARNTNEGPGLVQKEAQANLIALVDRLNTSTAGVHIFGGINTDTPPIADYYSNPTSAGRTAVANAFMADFGTTQSDPANAAIDSTAMQTFLDTTFAGLFDAATWGTNWSVASDVNMNSRISPFEVIETSANANEDPFRNLARAYTMIADLGVENLNRNTFGIVVDEAVRIAAQAIEDLSGVQANLGTAEARIARANERLSTQNNILTNHISDLENVDPFDASVRVTTLLTQIETAYSLTARVQRLTILNYL